MNDTPKRLLAYFSNCSTPATKFELLGWGNDYDGGYVATVSLELARFAKHSATLWVKEANGRIMHSFANAKHLRALAAAILEHVEEPPPRKPRKKRARRTSRR